MASALEAIVKSWGEPLKEQGRTMFEGLNIDYAVPSSACGPQWPAIQATDYQPKSLRSDVSLCISSESLDLLSEVNQQTFQESVYADFGKGPVKMFLFPESTRFIILGKPGLFVYDKAEQRYQPLQRGMRLAGTPKVTATRLLLACLINGELLTTEDGDLQLFTLNLRSSKTNLLLGDRKDPEFKSISSLNTALQKHFNKRGVWLTHLVSVSLAVEPRAFSNGKDSSVGIMFVLRPGGKALTEEQQKKTFETLMKDEVQAALDDPFGLKAPKAEENAFVNTGEEGNYDEMPF